MNPDYVSVQGRYIAFWFNDSDKIDYCPRYVGAKDKEVFHMDAKERMKISMSPYMHQCYAVHKKEAIKKALKASNEFFQPHVWELNLALVPSIFGNFKTLPIFYGAREAMDQEINTDNSPSFKEWFYNESSKNDLVKWRNAVVKIYSKLVNANIAASYSAFDDAVFAYLNQSGTNNLIIKKITKLKRFIPCKLIDLYRDIRYGGVSWPPQSNQARKLREDVLSEKGYPCSDKTADIEWHRMKDIIEKHGELNGVSNREFTAIEKMAT